MSNGSRIGSESRSCAWRLLRPIDVSLQKRADQNGPDRIFTTERAGLHQAKRAPELDLSPDGPSVNPRVRAAGKFLFSGQKKFRVKGVCYGPFRDQKDGEYGSRRQVERDFQRIRGMGGNAVRTYTVPPPWLLDAAAESGLRVLVGIPWAQHVAFLDDRQVRRATRRRVGEAARALAGHPAVLACAVGNEIPGPVVRWHGASRVERFLRQLCLTVKEADPHLLVTYANYPTTEYLRLPFVDFVSMNLYLETQAKLAGYLPRLQHLAGNRPLLVTEAGIDSRRNGLALQSEALTWQIEEAFAAGGAGIFVFSWSDQWHRGGLGITDWDFGLLDRAGRSKPALEAVGSAFSAAPFPPGREKPLFSVIVCVFNGAKTIQRCLDQVAKLDYPYFEVIIVDDGSTDDTGGILESFAGVEGFRMVRTENRGLSRARNLGMKMARGELVAFLDADARPDSDWLTYLEQHFSNHPDAGVGGPNVAPENQTLVARCVSMAPGGPVHVMVSDREAEHLPGCNMAFRKSELEAVGGFDPQFRVAGDDVDLCWRLQEGGRTLGFCPAALVWHESRPSIRDYWRQQKGYGRAEAILEFKWPEKYNTLGHLTWKGRIYDGGLSRPFVIGRWRIYHGVWGSGLFQSIYEVSPSLLRSLPMTPDWYLIMATLATLCGLSFFWPPLALFAPLLAFCGGALLLTAGANVSEAMASHLVEPPARRVALFSVTLFLHLLQPLARLRGRLGRGLQLTRRTGFDLSLPRRRNFSVWNESWRSPAAFLEELKQALEENHSVVAHGGAWDWWDLEVRGGVIGAVRIQMLCEEHGQDRQLIRFRCQPRWSSESWALIVIFASLAFSAFLNGALVAAAALGCVGSLFLLRGCFETAAATGALTRIMDRDKKMDGPGEGTAWKGDRNEE